MDGAMGLSTNVIGLYRLGTFRNIRGCTACEECRETGVCHLDDDIAPLLSDIKESSAVIVATPLYFSGPSAQYKALEDRMRSFYGPDGKPNIPPGKKAVILVTCMDDTDGAGQLASNLARFYSNLGFEILGKIVYASGGRETVDAETLAEAKRLGSLLRNN